MKHFVLITIPLVLSACAAPPGGGFFDGLRGGDGLVPPAEEASGVNVPSETLDETPPPPPDPEAQTVEEFDTTTAEDRAEAVAAPVLASGERSLGTTLTTLGSPTDPGIWLRTPLVSELQRGRATYAENGRTIALELRPDPGGAGGSQISLAAMRLLDAPLTDVIELEVLVGN